MAGKLAAPGGGGKRGRLGVNSDPNVIPFIDIMLVLVIIFMIAAPISSVDIEVDMPDARIDASRRPPRPTWISVQEKNGEALYYVMNENVPIEELGERTKEEWEKNSPGLDLIEDCLVTQTTSNDACRIYLRGEGDTQYRNIIRAMNQLQSYGFVHLALVAEDRR